MVQTREWDSDDFLMELLHPEWHKRAACRGMDLALFYPEINESSQAALDACATCPVREECSVSGKTESHGVWGGRLLQPTWMRSRSLIGVGR